MIKKIKKAKAAAKIKEKIFNIFHPMNSFTFINPKFFYHASLAGTGRSSGR